MSASSSFFVIYNFYTFYKIEPDQISTLKKKIEALAKTYDILGLMILAPEGLNTTYCCEEGQPFKIQKFTEKLKAILPLEAQLVPQVYSSEKALFLGFKVKIRTEIVTYKKQSLFPKTISDTHLTPEKWNHCLKNENVVVLDVRNDYEVRLGAFKKAINFNIKKFTEFYSQFKKSSLANNKDKKILMYCTGGVRCEKACDDLNNAGYNNVYQLQGGILNYLKQYPEDKFQGECFVFDSRVAVDQRLNPSQRYRLCPHCGDPSDKKINCSYCSEEVLICQNCYDNKEKSNLETCSKNCCYHKRLGHRFKKTHSQKTKYPKTT